MSIWLFSFYELRFNIGILGVSIKNWYILNMYPRFKFKNELLVFSSVFKLCVKFWASLWRFELLGILILKLHWVLVFFGWFWWVKLLKILRIESSYPCSNVELVMVQCIDTLLMLRKIKIFSAKMCWVRNS